MCVGEKSGAPGACTALYQAQPTWAAAAATPAPQYSCKNCNSRPDGRQEISLRTSIHGSNRCRDTANYCQVLRL